MKKKLMSLVAIAAIGLSVWRYSENQNSVEFSDLALANVEALANGETDSEHCDRLCSYAPNFYCLLESSSAYIYCFSKYPR